MSLLSYFYTKTTDNLKNVSENNIYPMLQMTVPDMSILFLCKPFSDTGSFVCCLRLIYKKSVWQRYLGKEIGNSENG